MVRATLTLLLISAVGFSAQARQTDPLNQPETAAVFARAPLAAAPYAPLPLGAVRAEGWLLEQLRRMATGLTGRLDELYATVGPSNAWRGGDGDSWERGPYWLDGLVPLAYLLDDPALIEKARPWIEWTLASQREDGFFGPADEADVASTYQLQRGAKADWWPRMVVLKVLQSHYEATGDRRVIDFMSRYFTYQLTHLKETPLEHWTMWAKSRGGENQASVFWLYNRTGDERLLELADLLFEQTLDWTGAFTRSWPDRSHAPTHVVNVAMGVKQPALQYLRTGDDTYLGAVKRGLAELRDRHGQVQGMFSGDEILHGSDPTQGTELCAVVEFMYSLETLMWISGHVPFIDQLERVAYNALPTHISNDFLTRQYFQQPNQVRISVAPRNFVTNHTGTDICYGLLSGYPCCTTNMHQGWPKFVQHLWLASRDGGIAALAYGPSRVSFRTRDGISVVIREETGYPFEETIRFTLEPESPAAFPLHLRIPAWVDSAEVRVNGRPLESFAGGRVAMLEGQWKAGDEVTLHLPMRLRTDRWHENALSVERGPLVFAFPIEAERREVAPPDTVRYGKVLTEFLPTGPWNYGLMVGPNAPASDFRVEIRQTEGYPWSVEAAPVTIRVRARRLPGWQAYGHQAGPLPYSPVPSTEPIETIDLIPYGATTLRVSTFPETLP